MDSVKRSKLIVRWSIVTAGLIAFFWLYRYLVNGSVPVVASIRMTSQWTVALPFGISRWWDVLMGPIWSVILILLFTNKQIRRDGDLTLGLFFGLVFGPVFGLVSGLVFGLGFGLASGLASGLVFGLGFGLGLGLVFGLFSGLFSGLALGLASGLALGLVFVLVFGLLKLIQILASKNFWVKIIDWLLAKD